MRAHPLAKSDRRRKRRRSFFSCEKKQKIRKKSLFRLHPLFIALGIFYCLKGELFLFLLSALVAVQHECAHAFAAAKLGYRLNAIVLMPFGAVIDGDLRGISLKDEIFVALCGPLCNLFTALFFVAIWWLTPTMYAFTDVACHSSLAIALINLLPAYPLDGGRILRCLLTRAYLKKQPLEEVARNKAERLCKGVTLAFSVLFFALFFAQCLQRRPNVSILIFGLFLLVGRFGNQQKNAVYDKMDFSVKDMFSRGAELRRVAILDSCPIKDTLRFLTGGCYLVLEVYDEQEHFLFDLSQNELSALFSLAATPYEPIGKLYAAQSKKNEPKEDFYAKK